MKEMPLSKLQTSPENRYFYRGRSRSVIFQVLLTYNLHTFRYTEIIIILVINTQKN